MQLQFATQRLLLSSLTLANDEFILTLVNTPGWLRFIGDRNVRTVEHARAYINKINQNPAFNYWVVQLKGEQTPIGIITFLKRDKMEFPDIGFAFLPAHTKLGYAFEATSVVLEYLSRERLIEYLQAITIPDNLSSIALLAKLGFGLEKETETDNGKLLVYGLKIV